MSFSNLDDEQKYKSAKKLLTAIRAFAKIEKGWDFQSITIGRGKTIVENNKPISIVKETRDSRSVKLMLPTIKGAIASITPVVVSINGVVQAPSAGSSERKRHLHDDYLDQCDIDINSTILDVLSDFAQVTSWPSLNRILGAVELDVGKKVEHMGWAQKGKISRFRWSATYYDALEDAKEEDLGLGKGRHPKLEYEKIKEDRLEKIQKGKNVNPYPTIMHLDEAESLIGCVLKKWLEFKKGSN